MSTDRTEAERLAHLTSAHKEWREDDCNVCFLIGQITRLQQERDAALERCRFYNVDGARLERERDAALKELQEYGESRDLIHRAAELIKTSEAHDRAGQLAAALQERDAASRLYARCVDEFADAKAAWLKEREALREEVGRLTHSRDMFHSELHKVKLQLDDARIVTRLHSYEAPAQPSADDCIPFSEALAGASDRPVTDELRRVYKTYIASQKRATTDDGQPRSEWATVNVAKERQRETTAEMMSKLEQHVATSATDDMERAREMRPNAEARRKRAWNRAAARSFSKGDAAVIDEHELRHAVEEALQDVWDAAVVATITAARVQPTTDDVERAREMTNSEKEIRDYVKSNSDRYDHDREPPLEFSYLRFAVLLLDERDAARAQGIAQGRAEMREMVLECIAKFGSGHAVTIGNAIRSLPTTPTDRGEKE